MSDLFHAGQARRTSGSITITMKNGKKLAKKLEKLKDGGETAIKRTVSDFTARAPAWVSKGIRQLLAPMIKCKKTPKKKCKFMAERKKKR